jgi:hypothetical protein
MNTPCTLSVFPTKRADPAMALSIRAKSYLGGGPAQSTQTIGSLLKNPWLAKNDMSIAQILHIFIHFEMYLFVDESTMNIGSIFCPKMANPPEVLAVNQGIHSQ